MEKPILFYLKTCSTCTKIMQQLDTTLMQLRELKSENITTEELQQMVAITGSYEALFSKKSTQIKARGIHVKSLTEKDFQELILDHYSFLKRPILLYKNEIFIGNSKENVQLMIEKYPKK